MAFVVLSALLLWWADARRGGSPTRPRDGAGAGRARLGIEGPPVRGRGREVLIVLGSYALGAVNAGYYTVRLLANEDVREIGSGSTGATNAGRVLGKAAFAGVFAFDCAKGAAAVKLAKAAGLDGAALGAVAVAVVVGHIWPAQLGFRGGKGAATAAGVLTVYHLAAARVIVFIFFPTFLTLRRFGGRGLVTASLVPALVILRNGVGMREAVVLLLAGITLSRNRENIGRYARRRKAEARMASS